jgi:hypothetical protein
VIKALVLVAGTLALLATGCGGGGTGGADSATTTAENDQQTEFVAASGQMSPRTHLFGDPVHLQVDVVVNRTQLDPNRISLKNGFKPYEQVGETTVTRHDAGDLTQLRFDTTIRCLEYACLTPTISTLTDPEAGAPRIFRFDPTNVLYSDPGADKPRVLRTVAWPQLEAVSRINGQDARNLFGFPFRWSVLPLPPLTTSISPSLLAALLLAGAALLLALPVTLVARRLRRRPAEVAEPELEASPLERALQLVEWSKTRSGDERRAALEALAEELDDVEDGRLADDTRAAAWQRPFPSPDDAGRLVAAVREAHGLAG